MQDLHEELSHKLMFQMQDVTYRKVLHDDKKGRQKVEVEQLAAWKFLMFSGSFATRLFVFQDKQKRTVGAEAAKPSQGTYLLDLIRMY